MPLFEYACRGCGRHFEAFVTADRTASCPGCESVDLQKQLSSPGMVGAGGGRREANPTGGCRAQGGHCGCSHNPSLN